MKLLEPPMSHDYPAPPPGKAGGGIDAGKIIRTLVRGLPLLVCTMLLGTALGVAALRYLPARYTSYVSILIDPKRPGALGEEGEFANLLVDNAKIADVELVLASSELLGRVVDEQHLAEDPAFGDAHESVIRRWLPFLGGRPPANTPEARRTRAIEHLRRIVHTARVNVTYVINLDVSAPDPARAQLLANAVATAYLTDQVETKLEAARRDSAWLTDQIREQRNELLQSEDAVEALRKKYGVLASGGGSETTVDRQAITQKNDDLVRAQAEVAATEAKYQQALRVAHGGGGLEGLSDVDSSKVIGELRTQQANAERRVADLSARYSTGFPARRQAEQDREAVNAQVALEVSRVVDRLRNDYQTAVAQRDTLQRELSVLVGRVSASENGEGRIELREAERVADANRAAYAASLAQLREVEQQQTHQDVEARIISPADLPDSASFPKGTMCIGGGIGFGLVSGLGLVFLFPYHRRRVFDVAGAESAFALPVLSTIPYLRKRDMKVGDAQLKITDYLVAKPVSHFSESLRLLRLHLMIGKKNGPRVIQITSAIPGEGKSTMAAALAVSAATAGIRTVIVDLDFHRPTIGAIFAGPQSEGVFDVLLGSSSTGSALRRHDTLPMRIIDAGSVGEPQPGLIEGIKLRELVKELQQEFDLVVLDTPPVLAVSDPLFVSGFVDATVMVVAWGATARKSIEAALAALRATHAPIAGLLLNKVTNSKPAKYYGVYYS